MINVSYTLGHTLAVFGLCLSLFVDASRAQTNQNFDFSLGVDYSSADLTLDFFDRRIGNADRIAKLRGNQLAALTSILLARTEKSETDFRDQLELGRNIPRFESDVYGFFPAKNHIPELRSLLAEAKYRQIDRRIVATLASYFPPEAKISTRFSLYFVVIGNERASAFERRVIWNYDTPTFVGDDEGEPVIVVNLARAVEASKDLHDQFIEILSTTAHECFHAAFSVLQKSLPDSLKPRTAVDQLMELVQNEGVAYLLSQETHIGGAIPNRNWFNVTTNAVDRLNSVIREMLSPNLTRERARQLILDANLSGSFEGNFGSTAGLRMAYEIDRNLGRPALTTTLLQGGRSFFAAYQRACMSDRNLHQLDRRILQMLNLDAR